MQGRKSRWCVWIQCDIFSFDRRNPFHTARKSWLHVLDFQGLSRTFKDFPGFLRIFKTFFECDPKKYITFFFVCWFYKGSLVDLVPGISAAGIWTFGKCPSFLFSKTMYLVQPTSRSVPFQKRIMNCRVWSQEWAKPIQSSDPPRPHLDWKVQIWSFTSNTIIIIIAAINDGLNFDTNVQKIWSQY